MKKATSIEILRRTSDQVLPEQNLEALYGGGKKLRIKYGVDVTAPFLHLGHAVNLWQMRNLQDMGHKVLFLIGDFTTRIGDPTGKSQTRPQISIEEIERNAHEFIKQVGKVLRTDPDVFEVRRNSEWYGNMPLHEFLGLLSHVTHGHLIQRDMFQNRISGGQEIRMHELVYPVLQGYDSYMLDADLTIVGSDQFFNEMMGRFFQQKFGQRPQSIVTTKITVGLDGKNKQSKSLNNYIALEDTPRDKFGKIMGLPDDQIVPFLTVYTDIADEEIQGMESELQSGKNPSHVKKQLAYAIVERYHGDDTAQRELEWFNRTFSQRDIPQDVPALSVISYAKAIDIVQSGMPGKSRTQLRTLFAQGAVKINGEKVTDPEVHPEIKEGDMLKVGKKDFFKLMLKNEAGG